MGQQRCEAPPAGSSWAPQGAHAAGSAARRLVVASTAVLVCASVYSATYSDSSATSFEVLLRESLAGSSGGGAAPAAPADVESAEPRGALAAAAVAAGSAGGGIATEAEGDDAGASGSNGRRLRVAFAIFMTDVSKPSWQDALAVLARGAHKAMGRSRHQIDLLAIAPERLEPEAESHMLDSGFKEVLKRPLPVEPSEIKGWDVRRHMEAKSGGKEKFGFAEETLKYWGLALTSYDRVLVLDADIMILDPMDELMELEADLVGTYDPGLDSPGSAMPPVQGGFLLFRPNMADFEEVKRLTLEGDWGGAGWKRSRIGHCYGGSGPDGLLQYYFNQGALGSHLPPKSELPEGLRKPRLHGSRFHAVERSMYDVVISKEIMANMRDLDNETVIANVKAVHFTGGCGKPWKCFMAVNPKDWLCRAMIEHWWRLRAELLPGGNLPLNSARPVRKCRHGVYMPLKEEAEAAATEEGSDFTWLADGAVCMGMDIAHWHGPRPDGNCAADCRARAGCGFFAEWPDGGCRLFASCANTAPEGSTLFAIAGGPSQALAAPAPAAPSPSPTPQPAAARPSPAPAPSAAPAHEASTRQPVRRAGGGRLRVAHVVFIADMDLPSAQDAAVVLGRSILATADSSRHQVDLLALVPEGFAKESERILLSEGYMDVMRRPLPVPASEIEGAAARESMQASGGLLQETIKYWALAMTRYDRVLLVDADAILLQPMDDLLDLEADLVGVYDSDPATATEAAVPGIHGGFLLLRPRQGDFEAVRLLAREADWGEAGWRGSGIGRGASGAGPRGLLQYYYCKDSLPLPGGALPEGSRAGRLERSRFHAVERSVYGVPAADGPSTAGVSLDGVKSARFGADGCGLPWRCASPPPSSQFCGALVSRWWQLRAELSEALTPLRRCEGGQYVSIKEAEAAAREARKSPDKFREVQQNAGCPHEASIAIHHGPWSGDCRAECSDLKDCAFYSRWPNGGCRLYHSCAQTKNERDATLYGRQDLFLIYGMDFECPEVAVAASWDSEQTLSWEPGSCEAECRRAGAGCRFHAVLASGACRLYSSCSDGVASPGAVIYQKTAYPLDKYARPGEVAVAAAHPAEYPDTPPPPPPAGQKLRVAFAAFVTDVASPAWRDALAVLAYGFHKATAKSRHQVELLALVPNRFPEANERYLLQAGFHEVLRRPVPVNPLKIKSKDVREGMFHLSANTSAQFSFGEETIKYWGMAQTHYDRVLVMDADVLMFDPMDELMENEADFVGTYDHGLDVKGTAMPPVQGGFLLFRPSKDDFDSVKALTEEGDWRGGEGWKGSKIGYCYGGIGPDGLLQYYFNRGALPLGLAKGELPEGLHKPRLKGSRFHPIDRSIYDVVVSKELMKELADAGVDNNADAVVDAVKSFHFTGGCGKPWIHCGPSGNWLCEALTEKWWQLRADMAEAHSGRRPEGRCVQGRYAPLSEEPSRVR